VMVTLTTTIQEMLREQKFIVVGSVDANGLCNISPRTSFYYSKNAIYWLDFFKHKSQGNFKTIPWVSVSVFDKKELKGFQLKGKVSFVTDKKEKTRITDIIMRSVTGKTSSKVFERVSQNKTPDVLLFTPKAIYSLDPKEESGSALTMDKDGETVSLLGI
ncbi:MAG TPA: pyridoxamine 5'-phosphate oxidase family protein, partial [Nitrosopumilaceae archaeon]|nr:pyridoxamine 5'-phosphate oxidase family protein [Nitrosopumilaceae archaeon]